MANEWILAIDQGTTNTKGLLFDRRAQTVFRSSAAVKLYQPRPGWVEQDPVELWQSVVAVATECNRFADSAGARIEGIALTNQRETALAWTRGNSEVPAIPLGNAITWQCRRSADVCDGLFEHSADIQSISGLPLDPLLSATKWAWIFGAGPEMRARSESGDVLFGTVDSWLLYNLTGGRGHFTDHSNASRTGLMSLDSLDWDKDLLCIFGIPRQCLPAIRPSGAAYGGCNSIAGLEGIPVVAMIGDSHGALVGHGCYEPGAVKATYGTGSSLMMLTRGLQRESDRLARSIAWSAAGEIRFALEGNIAMSGAALQWVGEFLGLQNPAEAAARLAATVTDAAGMIMVPAMVGLGAPHWDPAARGIISNLERSHTSAHLARAALDSIAHQIADVLECMETTANVRLPLILADGGATRNDSLMQMQADMIGRPVLRSRQEELSARGAAMLGGLTLGWWSSMDELAALPKDADRFESALPEQDRLALRGSWKLAVERTLARPARLNSPGVRH